LTEFIRREGESLLDADVLDHQIVDVNGLRVVRSSDLYLAPLDREIRVVGVDISFKAFIRRIFPGALGRGPIPEHVIDWANVASLAHGTGVVRSTESRAALGQLRPADLADLIEDLAGRERNALIEMLDPDLAADALEEMEDDELQGLLRGLSAERSAELISRMEPDEGAEVLRDLDDDHRESIFLEMDTSVAKQLRKLVEFDETLAGGIMTSHMLITHEADTVASALALLVEHRERDISDGVVVVDAKGKLLDHIQIIELIALWVDHHWCLLGPTKDRHTCCFYSDFCLDAVVRALSKSSGVSISIASGDSTCTQRTGGINSVSSLRNSCKLVMYMLPL